MSGFSKEDQSKKKVKEVYKLPPQSKDQAAHKERVSKAKEKAIEEGGGLCKETQSASFDCSHNFPEKHFRWLADDPRNITLLQRDKHQAWENSRLHELPNSSYAIYRGMVVLLSEETDKDHIESMYSFLTNKLYKSVDAAKSAGVDPLPWVLELIKSLE